MEDKGGREERKRRSQLFSTFLPLLSFLCPNSPPFSFGLWPEIKEAGRKKEEGEGGGVGVNEM